MADKIPARFTNADAARKHLEKLLWPEGPSCPHCGVVNEATALKGASTRPGVYWCNACQKPFSVTVGTVYESSKVALNVWLYATHLLCSSKKGISSHQLSRMLGASYKTAWFMAHRIREAMAPAANDEPMGGPDKIVEADEMFLGKSSKTQRKHGAKRARAVVALVERGGKTRSVAVPEANRWNVVGVLHEHVRPYTELHTDGAQHYDHLPHLQVAHETVNHSKKEYVRRSKSGRKVHTNTLEGYFSVFKRGLVGTYQHMSDQHLQRYLNEFDFRQSNRAALGVNDDLRTHRAIQGAVGKRLTYRGLKGLADSNTLAEK